MSPRDRTSEFFAAAQAVRTRGAAAGATNAAAYAQAQGGGKAAGADMTLRTPGATADGPQTEFIAAAKAVGREIQQVTEKLQKLTQLARRKSLFDDPTIEIRELSGMVKEHLLSINLEIERLQSQSQSSRGNKFSVQHSHNVVDSLKSSLATTTENFKSVLEVRSENIKTAQGRRKEYGAMSTLHAKASETTLLQRVDRGVRDKQAGGDDVVIDFTRRNQEAAQQQQMQLVQQDNYMQHRAEAVEQIESTIIELGEVFQKLGTMISEQGEMVQRIDDNVDESLLNAERAQNELSKYLRNISSNRWLVLKIFGVLIFFMIFFLVFVM